MAQPLNLPDEILGYKSDDEKVSVFTIEATCPSGFELAAKFEVERKFPGSIVATPQGRIIFDIFSIDRIFDVLKLRCIDNVYVLIYYNENSGIEKKELSEEESLTRIRSLVLNHGNWKKGLQIWSHVFSFSFESLPSFRCTCYRSGQKHNFTSPQVAKDVGGALQDKFNWKVSMKNYDIEVVVNVDSNQLYVGVSLNKESLFKRNIQFFGPTTLRATICASLLEYAKIQPGDIVVDPLCGGGSIPIEGSLGLPFAYYVGGDIHEKAIERTRQNASQSSLFDIVQWNVTQIPLRPGSVDVFVTDLPFGKRSGSKADNRSLYPQTMISMAKAVKPAGRAVVLSQDKTSMFKSMGKINPYWTCVKHVGVNIGGLSALVFILKRTNKTDFIYSSEVIVSQRLMTQK